MPALDQGLIAGLDKDAAFARVLVDVETDFIFAPQYKLLYEFMKDELWGEIVSALRSGTYNPSPLITAEIPKPSGLTRPGSILFPSDRILYQALADRIAPQLDPQLDDGRVISYRLLDPDPEGRMFEPRSDSYKRFKTAIGEGASQSVFAIQTDVASYFSHINHHVLENLIAAAGVPEGIVRLLVKTMLETWSGRFSYSIPQGMFPSDLLGNYYLSTLDTHLATKGIPSVRYVDDLVMFYDDQISARASISEICRFLRTIGLDLNESKTSVISSAEAVKEETALDRRFESARDEVYGELLDSIAASGYGFLNSWETPIDDAEVQDVAESEALDNLWDERPNTPLKKRDQLDRFCLGAFARLGSTTAVGAVLAELGERPHMTQIYCAYLGRFVRKNPDIQVALGTLITRRVPYDSELQWPIAALLPADSVPQHTVNAALGILRDRTRSNEIRALCAILVGKFGSGASRTVLRGHWGEETSEHVKAAMVYSLRFFDSGERNTLLNHWGAQGKLYELIAKAVRKSL